MELRHITGDTKLYFASEDPDAADIAANAYIRSTQVIGEVWNLAPPRRCRIYIMTSWFSFLFSALPWYRRPAFLIILPFWFARYRRAWRVAGGWTMRYKNNPVVGVKPPRLLATSDTSIGELIFLKEPDLNKKMSWILCHELTHAFSAHLKLPLWLNEGIAMVAADEYMGICLVRQDTIRSLNHPRRRRLVGRYQDLPKMKKEDIVYQYVRGYWITRFLMDRHPDLLKSLLDKRRSRRFTEKTVARALGLRRRTLWKQIDGIVMNHFKSQSSANTIITATE